MLRLFAAIEIPEPIRDQLPMPDGQIPGCNWVEDENLHITLRFLGDVDNAQAQTIDEVLETIRASAFPLALHGLDTFGGRNPHALYAGVRPSPALLHLYQKIDTALTRTGFPNDRAKYVPHVTLARLRSAPDDKIAAFIQAHNLFDCDPFEVTEFHLYSSVLHAGGSVYTIERTYPLS
jgi:RNA 2',3'-cyclic 3'-phosphodiesterase